MKQLITGIVIVFLFASCRNESKIIVPASFVDSLINNYTDTTVTRAIDVEIRFWKNRINPASPGLVNELKYASALVQRFHLSGNINDLITADSILLTADQAFNHQEPAPLLALMRNSILQHRFKAADSLFEMAKIAGLKPYEMAVAGFDVAFELGYYPLAQHELKKIADPTDYGYNFRLAKLAHYHGELDTAVAAMHRASVLAGANTYLKQAALSNEADLNLHNSDLQQAYDLYVESLRLGNTDLHAVMGIGWIALIHDKNDSLAERIFRFVQSKTKAPDAVFKMLQVAEARGDAGMQLKYANDFVSLTTSPVYGNMYNKYLLELYAGVLRDPAKAELLAKKELVNRATPQTNAWYTWALYSNNNIIEAEKTYQQYVSGKPLEGLELFWMGKYMQAQNKAYNAQQFFKAAFNNRYDLSLAMVMELENGQAK